MFQLKNKNKEELKQREENDYIYKMHLFKNYSLIFLDINKNIKINTF